MRPLRIEIQGFTAFRDHQEVGLEDLDLFVITGQTGAGKTSLLDAMIFALYGRVPRASSHGMRELVTLGEAEARVKLEFALDGGRYRVSRRLPREGSQSATIEIFDGDDWQPDPELDGSGVTAANKRLVELLKLPYDAFVKAVVLPQGEWHRFLKGEPKERRQILTDLLGLKHYLTMGERARGRAKELSTRVEKTEEILEERYAEVGEKQLEALRVAAAEVADRVTTLRDLSRTATEQEAEREDLDRLAGEAAEVKSDLDDLAADLASTAEGIAEAEKREGTATEAVKMATAAVAKSKARGETASQALTKLRTQYGDLESLAKVNAALGETESCEEERAEPEKLLAEAATEASELTTHLGHADEALAEATMEVEAAHVAAEAVKGAETEATGAAREIATALERVDEDLERAQTAGKELDEARSRRGSAEEALEPIRERLAEAQRALAALEHEHAAVALAIELEPGDPCPVCKRPLDEHPKLGKLAKTALDKARTRRAAAEKAEGEAQAELSAAIEAAKRADAEHRAAQEALAKRLGDYANRDKLATAAEAAQQQAGEAKRRAEETASALGEAQTRETSARGTVAQINADARSCEERTGLLSDRLSAIDRRREMASTVIAEHFGSTLPKDPVKQLAAERQQIVGAQDAVEQARQAEAAGQKALDEARGALDEAKAAVGDVDGKIAVLRTRAEQAREDLLEAYEGRKGIPAPAVLPRAVKDRQPHLTRLQKWVMAALERIRELEQTLAAEVHSTESRLLELAAGAEISVNDAGRVCEELNDAEAGARRDQGASDAQVKAMEERIKEKAEMTADIAKETAGAAVLRGLGAELRSDRFLAFIQQETLDLLAARASDELQRISGYRYSLVSEEGSFFVIDHVNADEKRSVDTLSGGETFMASLSLALALSQHVGEMATEGMGAKLEAVFIDEGFGALDDETLEDVIDALERLREGELMVGVITHVKALAERVSDRIQVETANGRATLQLAAA